MQAQAPVELEQPLAKAPTSVLTRSLLVGLVLLLVVVCVGVTTALQLRPHDPYVTEVLQRQGDRERGHAIFQINCSGCHGIEATGLVGPNLWGVSSRKSTRGLITQVTSGQTPPMPKFQPSPQEMADLLVYLQSL